MKTAWFLLDIGEVDSFSHFDALPISCLLIDAGKIMAVNSCFAEFIGKSKEALKSADISLYFDSESDTLDTLFSRDSDSQKQVVLKVSKANGTSQTVTANINAQNDQKGSCKGVLVTLSEINSDHGQTESPTIPVSTKSQVSDSSLAAILESSVDGISVIDKDFNVVHYNQTAYSEFLEFTGVDLANPEGIKPQLSNEELKRWSTVYAPVFRGEKKTELVKRDNGDRFFRNYYTPVRNEQGEILGALEVSREVTDHVKNKAELFASKEKLNNIIEHTPIGIARVGLDGRITYVSKRGAALFDLTVDEMMKKTAIECIPKEQHGVFLKNVQSLLSGAKEEYSEFTVNYKDGSPHVLKGKTAILRNDKGEPEEFFLAYMDATAELKKERALLETETTYNSLFSNMLDAVLVYDLEAKQISDCNKAALTLYGKSREQIIHNESFKVVPSESVYFPDTDLQQKLTGMISGIDEKVTQHTLLSIAREDGTERYVKTSLVKVGEKSDQLYLIMKDVTNEHNALQEVREQSSLFEALIHNSHEGIEIIKYENDNNILKNGKIVVRNNTMREMMGHLDDSLFDTVEELMSISPEYQPSGDKSSDVIKKAIVDTIKNGFSHRDYRFIPKDADIPLDVMASQRLIPLGNYIYSIKNYRDISDEVKQQSIIGKQMEDSELKNDELKKYIESNLQLENFAYIASHDLKAPIRSVISFAQLLKNNVYKDLDDKNKRFLDIMITASTNMQVLIDDLLSYSRINTQKIEFENVDLKKMLNYLLIEIGENIKEKDGEVIIGKLPESIVVDASRIRQVFQNLITNSMKFHKPGEKPKVEISYKENATHYEFTLRDYGIGIEEHYLSEIFLMFKKLHSENKYKGTGIGLSICKKIVEQHNGDIRAESVLGEGTTFIFTISKALELTTY